MLNRSIVLSVILCIIANISSAQTWNWAKGEGDIGNDASNAVTTDASGNTYVTGNIAGKGNFSGTVYQGNGIYEMFIAKYDVAGNLVWVKLAGGSGNDDGNDVKWHNGFVYVCGTFEGTAFFETTSLISKGGADAFIAKYTDAGSLVWVRSMGGTGAEDASAIDVDNAENVYVGGNYERAITIGTTNLTTNNFYKESFYAKYSNNGNVSWAKTSTGNNGNLIAGIAFDNHQAVYLTGYFGGSFKVGTATVNSVSSSYDIFLAKVEVSDGSVDWLKRSGSTYEDGAHDVCSDADGNPSITGYFAGTALFDNNTVPYLDYNDVFIARYDTAGNNLWVRAGRGNKLDVGFSIACDANGNLIATGMFQNIIDFDGRILNAPDLLDRDIFLISYDKSGNIRWITRAGAEDTDCALGVALHTDGDVSISGYYLFKCSFGTIPIDYAEGNDLFLARYTQPVISGIDEVGNDVLNVSVYPNPANSDAELLVGNAELIPLAVRVCNALGQEVYNGNLTTNCKLSTSNWSAGIYFIEVSSAEKVKTIKLIKQ